MKLNLAALPKEEVWNVWRVAMMTGAILNTDAAEKRVRTSSESECEDYFRGAIVFSQQNVAFAPQKFQRRVFELWWSEQTGQGET